MKFNIFLSHLIWNTLKKLYHTRYWGQKVKICLCRYNHAPFLTVAWVWRARVTISLCNSAKCSENMKTTSSICARAQKTTVAGHQMHKCGQVLPRDVLTTEQTCSPGRWRQVEVPGNSFCFFLLRVNRNLTSVPRNLCPGPRRYRRY